MTTEAQSPVAFVDTETGGLDALRHEILELALVLTSPDASEVLMERAWKLRPEHPELIDPQAAAVNGYTPEDWADARPAAEVLDEFCAAATGAVVCGHNVGFDRSFVEASLRRVGLSWPCRYRTVDTCAMAWPLVHRGVVPDGKLTTLAAHFGIDTGEPHRALTDARTCRQLYLRLMETWGLGLDAPRFRIEYPRGPFDGPVLVGPDGTRHAERAGRTWCGLNPGTGWLLVTPIGVSRGDPRGVAVPDCPACTAAARAARAATAAGAPA